jgi:hypothetical protein
MADMVVLTESFAVIRSENDQSILEQLELSQTAQEKADLPVHILDLQSIPFSDLRSLENPFAGGLQDSGTWIGTWIHQLDRGRESPLIRRLPNPFLSRLPLRGRSHLE